MVISKKINDKKKNVFNLRIILTDNAFDVDDIADNP